MHYPTVRQNTLCLLQQAIGSVYKTVSMLYHKRTELVHHILIEEALYNIISIDKQNGVNIVRGEPKEVFEVSAF